VYAGRPVRCRQFECALFQSVESGRTGLPAALRIVRQAAQRAEKVRRLLRELGDERETLALSLRFQRTRRRIESAPVDGDTAEIYGRLTLALHDLHVTLRGHFYP
jgi:hypothetical protein